MRYRPGFAVMVLLATGGVVVAGLAPGAQAPAITVEALVQGPGLDAVTPEALQGQAVVLDFWATWCGPCVADMPHWNELVETFEGKPVRFIAVSDEAPERLSQFLQSKPMRGWIGADPSGSTFASYRIIGRPTVVLIDRQGVVRGVTHPVDVTPRTIRAVLKGRTPRLPSSKVFEEAIERALDAGGKPPPVFQAVIRPASGEDLTTKIAEDEYIATGAHVSDVLVSAWQASPARMAIETDLPERAFDFVFEVPGGHEALWAQVRRALESAFHFQATREAREADVYLLKSSPETSRLLASSAGEQASRSMQPGRMQAFAMSMPELASSLEGPVGRPIVDATGLEGRYDIVLRWEGAASSGLPAALAEQAGLTLEPARRTIDLLVVKPARLPEKP